MKLWTSVELAEATGLSDRQIRYHIVAGKIPAQKLGKSWVISDDDAKMFIESRQDTKQDKQ